MSYYSDVSYNLWRSGCNADIDHDAVSNYKADGYSAEEAANAIMRREDQARVRRQEAIWEEESRYQQEEERREEEFNNGQFGAGA